MTAIAFEIFIELIILKLCAIQIACPKKESPQFGSPLHLQSQHHKRTRCMQITAM